MSRNIGIIIAIIIFINFIIGTVAKSKKGNPSNKNGRKAKPSPDFSRSNRKSRNSTPKTRRVSDIEKEYLIDSDFSGTFSQDGSSFIPNPEIEDPKDSKAFYVVILGLVVLAIALYLVYYLY